MFAGSSVVSQEVLTILHEGQTHDKEFLRKEPDFREQKSTIIVLNPQLCRAVEMFCFLSRDLTERYLASLICV
jgi:hypothetical protein